MGLPWKAAWNPRELIMWREWGGREIDFNAYNVEAAIRDFGFRSLLGHDELVPLVVSRFSSQP